MVDKKSDQSIGQSKTIFVVDPDIKDKVGHFETKYDENIYCYKPCTMIVGQTRSGKTCLLQNILYRCILDEIKPKNIFLFSKTALRDQSWSEYLKYLANIQPSLLYSNIHTNFNELESMIKKWDEQAIMNPKEVEQKVIILDDMIGSKLLSQHTSYLANYIPVCRHSGCSFVILTQKYNAIATTIRQNTEQLYIGFCSTGLKSFIQDINQLYKDQQLINMYMDVVKDRSQFNFLIIRKDLPMESGYFRKNFDEILQITDY